MMTHLWEVEHSYYCNDGNYTKNDCLTEYESWAAFAAPFEDIDLDYNLLFRWDWKPETDDDGEPTEAGKAGKGMLKLYWMQQRRGHFTIDHVTVGPEDEEAVRVWLGRAWTHLRDLWAPLEAA